MSHHILFSSVQSRLLGCVLLGGMLLFPSIAGAFQAKVINLTTVSGQSRVTALTIVGAVPQPGCYELPPQQSWTLETLIQQAGGLAAESGTKIKVVRGERAGIVLMYPAQKQFELISGDVVIIERQRPTAARVISYQNQEAVEVRRADHEQVGHSFRGHIVLLGLKPVPVVMPLWKSGLTREILLTTYLKQDPQVAAGTQLLAGQPLNKATAELADGMVLRVPTHLVNQQTLPPLPEAVSVPETRSTPVDEGLPKPATGTQPAVPGVSFSPEPTPAFLPAGNNGSAAETLPAVKPEKPAEITTPGETITRPNEPDVTGGVLTPEPLVLLPLHPSEPRAAEVAAVPADSVIPRETVSDSRGLLIRPDAPPLSDMLSGDMLSETETFSATRSANQSDNSELRPFGEMLEETMQSFGAMPVNEPATAETMSTLTMSPFAEMQQHRRGENQIAHEAIAGEIVPPPQDVQPTGPSTLGIIAGLIVLSGVIYVIASAVINQLQQNRQAEQEWKTLTRQRLQQELTIPAFEQTTGLGQNSQGVQKPQPAPESLVVEPAVAETSVTETMSPVKPRIKLRPAEQKPIAVSQQKPLQQELTQQKVAQQTVSQQVAPQQATSPAAVESVLTEIFPTPIVQPPNEILSLLNLPVEEEQVAFPKELRFYGKPQLHYEFRIDAQHDLPKPHVSLKNFKMKPELQTSPVTADNRQLRQDQPEWTSPPADSTINTSNETEVCGPEQIPPGLFASAYARHRELQKSEARG